MSSLWLQREALHASSSAHRDCSIEMLSIRSEASSPIFIQLARLSGVSCLRCLSDRFVGFALLDEISIPCLMNWRTRVVTKLRVEPSRDVSLPSFGFKKSPN